MLSKITIRMIALGCAVLLLAGTWSYMSPPAQAGSCGAVKPAPKAAAATCPRAQGAVCAKAQGAVCPLAKGAVCKCATCAAAKCPRCNCKPCKCG